MITTYRPVGLLHRIDEHSLEPVLCDTRWFGRLSDDLDEAVSDGLSFLRANDRLDMPRDLPVWWDVEVRSYEYDDDGRQTMRVAFSGTNFRGEIRHVFDRWREMVMAGEDHMDFAATYHWYLKDRIEL